MKTAISIPDDVFRAAERTAKRMSISRSQLYTTDVREFLESRTRDDITRRLNQVYAEQSSNIPPELLSAQVRALGDSTW
jgi:hypothetical protein